MSSGIGAQERYEEGILKLYWRLKLAGNNKVQKEPRENTHTHSYMEELGRGSNGNRSDWGRRKSIE